MLLHCMLMFVQVHFRGDLQSEPANRTDRDPAQPSVSTAKRFDHKGLHLQGR